VFGEELEKTEGGGEEEDGFGGLVEGRKIDLARLFHEPVRLGALGEGFEHVAEGGVGLKLRSSE